MIYFSEFYELCLEKHLLSRTQSKPKTKGAARRQRAARSNDASLKRAGISRARSRGRTSETIIKGNGGDNDMSTVITTYKSPENFIRGNLPRIKGNKSTTGSERALIAKRLKKQIKKVGGSSKSKVHDPEIVSNSPARSTEISMSNAKQRAINLKNAAQNVPNAIKTAKGRSGDIVSGHPSSPHEADSERGKAARAKIYSKIKGSQKKPDKITGKMMGKVK